MSDVKKFKIGVMGVRRGGAFMRMFHNNIPEAEISAVCEVDSEIIEKFKTEYPGIPVYTDFDEFIDSGLDAVALANFFHEHAKYAIKAMDKGIAVLSETTAAPTLGECVDLVEAAERTGAKYMLAANCLYFPAVHAMKPEIESGKYGDILYAEAEYIHGNDSVGEIHPEGVDCENLHWRQTLPATYYNMHSLGPLMYVTNTVPVKVSGGAVCKPEYAVQNDRVNDTPVGWIRATMDNGAVFTTTGWADHAPTSKWYRVSCEKGTLETGRYDHHEDTLLIAENLRGVEHKRQWWDTSGVVPKEDNKPGRAEAVGHGGIDYFIGYYFIKYLKGEHEPFLDVYRSVALSAAGILAWYSVLSDGLSYDIPDFRIKEERDKIRGDYRTPFAKNLKDITLPCRMADKDKFEK